MLRGRGPNSFFARGYPVVSEPFINKTFLSPLGDLDTVVINQFSINMKIYFWTLDYIPAIYMSILMPILQHLYYRSFAVRFKIRKGESSNNILS